MLLRWTTMVAISMALAACSGNGENARTSSTFSSFSEIPEDGVTVIEGQAVTANYTVDPSTGDVTISNVSGPSASTTTVTTERGVAVALRATAPGSTVSFDTRSGDTRTDLGGAIAYTSADGQDTAIYADPAAMGYEYQTYGSWLTGSGTQSGSVGSGSYGSRTRTLNVPTGTNATYSGTGLGVARLSDGQPYNTVSNVQVTTDFNTATISSSGTQATNLNTLASGPASELDFLGSGPVNGSGFVASVSGAGDLKGEAQGQFYGPRANEVGGTFMTSGSGGVMHSGAFGGN